MRQLWEGEVQGYRMGRTRKCLVVGSWVYVTKPVSLQGDPYPKVSEAAHQGDQSEAEEREW